MILTEMYILSNTLWNKTKHISLTRLTLLSDKTAPCAPLSAAVTDKEQDELLKPLVYMLESDLNVYRVKLVMKPIKDYIA